MHAVFQYGFLQCIKVAFIVRNSRVIVQGNFEREGGFVFDGEAVLCYAVSSQPG
jgi:hypothetical protein